MPGAPVLCGVFASAVPRLAIRQYNYYVECNSGAYANGARAPLACPAEEKPSGSGNKPSGNTNRAVGCCRALPRRRPRQDLLHREPQYDPPSVLPNSVVMPTLLVSS